jgi:hypothetical protein
MLMFVTSHLSAAKFHLHLIGHSLVGLTSRPTDSNQIFHETSQTEVNVVHVVTYNTKRYVSLFLD